jgi:hypothetical protein
MSGKSGLAQGLIFATQTTTQIGREVRATILGTVGNVTVFRVGVEDAKYFGEEFGQRYSTSDFLNLPARNAYTRILIDGNPCPAFSMETIAIAC